MPGNSSSWYVGVCDIQVGLVFVMVRYNDECEQCILCVLANLQNPCYRAF